MDKVGDLGKSKIIWSYHVYDVEYFSCTRSGISNTNFPNTPERL
jgi:hypothetical protein